MNTQVHTQVSVYTKATGVHTTMPLLVDFATVECSQKYSARGESGIESTTPLLADSAALWWGCRLHGYGSSVIE